MTPDDEPVPNAHATHGYPPAPFMPGAVLLERRGQPRGGPAAKTRTSSGSISTPTSSPGCAGSGPRGPAPVAGFRALAQPPGRDRPRRGSAARAGGRAGRSPAPARRTPCGRMQTTAPAPSARPGAAKRPIGVVDPPAPAHALDLVEIAEEARREDVDRAAVDLLGRALLDDPARAASARCGRRSSSPPRDRG